MEAVEAVGMEHIEDFYRGLGTERVRLAVDILRQTLGRWGQVLGPQTAYVADAGLFKVSGITRLLVTRTTIIPLAQMVLLALRVQEQWERPEHLLGSRVVPVVQQEPITKVPVK